MLKIRRPLGRLIFNMGIAIPGKTVFLIETPPQVRTELTCKQRQNNRSPTRSKDNFSVHFNSSSVSVNKESSSYNGLSPVRCQGIPTLMLNYCSFVYTEEQKSMKFWYHNCHLKNNNFNISSAKWWRFCLGHDVSPTDPEHALSFGAKQQWLIL